MDSLSVAMGVTLPLKRECDGWVYQWSIGIRNYLSTCPLKPQRFSSFCWVVFLRSL